MSKQFWAVIAVIVLAFIGIAVFNGNKSDDGSAGNSKGTPTSHFLGNKDSSVKLVEYGDFQCPFCQIYHAPVKQVVEKYKDQISFQFVNYPLTSLHQNAFAAARAAEAADKQGKYWEMYDIIYQNADPNAASGWVASTSPTSFFNQFARQIGLDETKFKADYASSAVNNAINADLAKGQKLNVEGTPTFFLNGKKLDTKTLADSSGMPSVEAMSKVIDEALSKASNSGQ